MWSTINRPVLCALLVSLATLVLAACGGQRLDVNEPRTSFTVDIPRQVFPASQTLSEHTHLVLSVHNDSNRTIPNVAVTICNVTCKFPAPPGEGTSAQAFANSVLAGSNENPSRQIWIIDKPPDPAGCKGRAGYSCAGASYGGATTYDNNTWALGPLKANQTRTFDWAVTAVKPGRHVVAWEVSAGLSGKAKAVLQDGSVPHGTFPVTVTRTPAQSYVNQSGQIVSSPNGR
jgi:hypothetical protein